MDNATVALPKVRQDFVIPKANLANLQAQFDKLNRRAAKNGLAPIVLTITGDEFVKHFNESHHEVEAEQACKHIAYLPIRVEGETPRVNGWDFIATLQHLGEDGNIIRAVPGLDVHVPVEYRTAKPVCDHCHLHRARKDTYVLRNAESAEFKQVGTNCLADFIRTGTPQAMADAAELLACAMDAASDACGEGGGGHGSSLTSFVELMTWVIAVVRVEGAFVSKTKARIAEEMGDYANAHATVNDALTCIFGRGKEADAARKAYRPQTGEAEKAREVIAWGRENVPALLAADESNDYLYNLSVAIKRDYLEPRLSGLAASLLPVYNRDLAKKALAKMNRETLGGSKHFGQVGDRIKLLGVTLLHTYKHEGGEWGPTYITKLLTDSGNVAVWFASSPLSKFVTKPVAESAVVAGIAKAGQTIGEEKLVEYGERVVINGTVKKHDERDGIKQTVLGRCTVWTDEGIEKELAKQARKAAREAKNAARKTSATGAAQEAA